MKASSKKKPLPKDDESPDPLVAQLVGAFQAAGLTQRVVAAESGIAEPNVSLLMTGRKTPTIATLRRLAEVVGLRVALVPKK